MVGWRGTLKRMESVVIKGMSRVGINSSSFIIPKTLLRLHCQRGIYRDMLHMVDLDWETAQTVLHQIQSSPLSSLLPIPILDLLQQTIQAQQSLQWNYRRIPIHPLRQLISISTPIPIYPIQLLRHIVMIYPSHLYYHIM